MISLLASVFHMRRTLRKNYGSNKLGTPNSVEYSNSIPCNGYHSLCPPNFLCHLGILLILLCPCPKSKTLMLRVLYYPCHSMRLVHIILFFALTLFYQLSRYSQLKSTFCSRFFIVVNILLN